MGARISENTLVVTCRIDKQDVERLKTIAELKGMSFAELTRQVLKHYADSKQDIVQEYIKAKEKLDSFDF